MENVVSVDKIKLIIWDLDETLWSGTISERKVELAEDFATLIRASTDAGIVHSICSKNDFTVAKEKLQELGLWEYFVFPSINWEPKGNRIKEIISTMNLRAENVLFIDDNIQNLKEALFYNEKLMTLLPADASALTQYPFARSDIEHKRLKQYRVLEAKHESQKNFSSNEEFLLSCKIKVTIHTDCIEHIDRLHELLMRSNQLNYTKNRCAKDELLTLFQDPAVNSGYVTVSDSFGDYGIVGFFCVKDHKAIHYLFSCRTLGMLVEQYVYMQLNCPELEVVGDVATVLNNWETPPWINQSSHNDGDEAQGEKVLSPKSVLFKGPCDVSQVFSFIKETDTVKHEFTYMNDLGISIEGHNHCAQLASALTMSQCEKDTLLSQCVWLDKNCFDTQLRNTRFDYLILSMVTDASLGLYQHKTTKRYVSFYCRKYDITRKEYFQKYEQSILAPSKLDYQWEDYERFVSEFEYVPNDDYAITISSLTTIWELLRQNNTKLILLLGTERKYPGEVSFTYQDREKEHTKLNSLIRSWAQGKEDVILLPFDKYLDSDKLFLDTINHFKKIVYFKMAKDLVEILEKDEAIEICNNGTLYKKILIEKVKSIVGTIKKFLS